MTPQLVLVWVGIVAVLVFGIWYLVVCIQRVRQMPGTVEEWAKREASEGWSRDQTLDQWAKREAAVSHLRRVGTRLGLGMLGVLFILLFGPNPDETFPQIIPPWEWLW